MPGWAFSACRHSAGAFGRVLISVDKPFSAGSAVLAYNGGKLLGRILEQHAHQFAGHSADHLSALLKLN